MTNPSCFNQFAIGVSETPRGFSVSGWTTVLTGSLPSLGPVDLTCNLPTVTLDISPPSTKARYVRFEALTYNGFGAGLEYINIIQAS